MRVVLDTNVLISGICWPRNWCGTILDLWQDGSFEVIASEPILHELDKVLNDFKIPAEDWARAWGQQLMRDNSTIVTSSIKLSVVKDDPDDDKFIEAAVEGNAQYIITQDKHLLRIGSYGEIKIVTPLEFLNILK